MSGVSLSPVIAPETGETTGPRQCRALTACQDLCPRDFPRWMDFAERCPNRAEVMIWYSCSNGHQHPEEVCAGHIDPPGTQWCGICASAGEMAAVTVTVIGWI